MRSRYAALPLGVVLVSLALAAPSQAHELTSKQAKRALGPTASELVGRVGPAIAQKLPGATVAGSRVAACDVRSSHRAVCAIVFGVQGASIGETECGIDAVVRFKNRRSRKLVTSVGTELACFFPVPLP